MLQLERTRRVLNTFWCKIVNMVKYAEDYGDPSVYYQKYYDVCGGSSNSSLFFALMHRLIESKENLFNLNDFSKTLEIGAGSGQHFKYVNHSYTIYINSDIRFPQKDQNFGPGFIQIDAHSTPFKDESLDRVLSTCVLAHMQNPEQALSEWKRIVKHGGVLNFLVPCEPGLLLRFFRYFSTARKSKKLGYEGYGLCLAREHIIYFLQLDTLISYIFRNDQINRKFFPFRFIKSWNLNFFVIYSIKII